MVFVTSESKLNNLLVVVRVRHLTWSHGHGQPCSCPGAPGIICFHAFSSSQGVSTFSPPFSNLVAFLQSFLCVHIISDFFSSAAFYSKGLRGCAEPTWISWGAPPVCRCLNPLGSPNVLLPHEQIHLWVLGLGCGSFQVPRFSVRCSTSPVCTKQTSCECACVLTGAHVCGEHRPGSCPPQSFSTLFTYSIFIMCECVYVPQDIDRAQRTACEGQFLSSTK